MNNQNVKFEAVINEDDIEIDGWWFGFKGTAYGDCDCELVYYDIDEMDDDVYFYNNQTNEYDKRSIDDVPEDVIDKAVEKMVSDGSLNWQAYENIPEYELD